MHLQLFLFKGDEVYKNLKSVRAASVQELLLLKLMLGQFNFLLLDEPTNHLDAFFKGRA